MSLDRSQIVPPHSIEGEESVIGGVLVHAARLAKVIPLVKPEDFYHPGLRAIYEAMIDLDADSAPVDSLTVAERMRALGTFDRLRAVGGDDYFIELAGKVVTVENISYHARLVRSKANRRRWVLKLSELAAAGYRDGTDDDYFAETEQELVALTMNRIGDTGPRRVYDVMDGYRRLLEERFERRQKTGNGITGIPTGYGELDFLLSGLHGGDLVIIAGRPGMGKTAFAMNVVVNAARLSDEPEGPFVHPALVFSLEMSEEQLAERMVSGESRVNSMRLRQGDLGQSHWLSITTATGVLADLPIHIETRGTITVAEIRSIARVWRMGLAANPAIAKDAKPIVVIDYMQLVTASGKKKQSSREQDVSEISRGLKHLAKDLRCPVVALSQLNRSLETRTNKRPMQSDLRESGAIEQDADVIAFVYRDEVYHQVEPGQCPDCRPGVAEIIVSKQRMGPCATAHVTFVPEITRFENLSHRGGAG